MSQQIIEIDGAVDARAGAGRVQPRRAWPGPSLHCWAANIDFGYTKSISGHQKSVFEYQKN